VVGRITIVGCLWIFTASRKAACYLSGAALTLWRRCTRKRLRRQRQCARKGCESPESPGAARRCPRPKQAAMAGSAKLFPEAGVNRSSPEISQGRYQLRDSLLLTCVARLVGGTRRRHDRQRSATFRPEGTGAEASVFVPGGTDLDRGRAKSSISVLHPPRCAVCAGTGSRVWSRAPCAAALFSPPRIQMTNTNWRANRVSLATIPSPARCGWTETWVASKRRSGATVIRAATA